MIILITASVSSKICNKAFVAGKFCVQSDIPTWEVFINFVRILGCFSHCDCNAPGLPWPKDDGDEGNDDDNDTLKQGLQRMSVTWPYGLERGEVMTP